MQRSLKVTSSIGHFFLSFIIFNPCTLNPQNFRGRIIRKSFSTKFQCFSKKVPLDVDRQFENFCFYFSDLFKMFSYPDIYVHVVTSMLVTHVGNYLCEWQVWDAHERFFTLKKFQQDVEKPPAWWFCHWHPKTVTIMKSLIYSCHHLHCVLHS